MRPARLALAVHVGRSYFFVTNAVRPTSRVNRPPAPRSTIRIVDLYSASSCIRTSNALYRHWNWAARSFRSQPAYTGCATIHFHPGSTVHVQSECRRILGRLSSASCSVLSKDSFRRLIYRTNQRRSPAILTRSTLSCPISQLFTFF